MAPNTPHTSIESYEERLQELRLRQFYLSHKINALNKKNDAARSWMKDSRKDIITTYNSLNDMIQSGQVEDIIKTLTAEQKKIDAAQPKLKDNEVHCRIKNENGDTFDFDFQFTGRLPQQGAFIAALKKLKTGLSDRRLNEVYDNAKRVILTDRRSELKTELFDTPADEQLNALDDADLKIVTLLHDRKPLPKPTPDLHSIWGVVLDIEHKGGMRAARRISEEFADNKKLQSLLNNFQLGVPQSIFVEIDENTRRDIEDNQNNAADNEIRSNWWGRITGQEDRDYLDAIAETKTELLSVENNAAFAKAMNESLFSWLEAMTVDTGAKEYPAPETHEHLLYQYQQAEFVIRIAQNDFNETLRSFTDSIMDEANEYVQLTQSLKDLSKSQNRDILKGITRQNNFDDFREWVLEDTKFNSLTQLAYKQLGATYDLVQTLKIIEENTDEKPLELLFPNDDLVSDSAKKLLSKFLPLTMKKKASADLIKTTLSTVCKTIQKSGGSFETTITQSGTLQDIFASDLSDTHKTDLIVEILMHTNLYNKAEDLQAEYNDNMRRQDIKYHVESAASLLNTDTSENKWEAVSGASFEKTHALAKMLAPETDILNNYLNAADQKNSAAIFMTLWSRGLTGKTISFDETVKTVIANALDNKEWQHILPSFYQLENPEFITTLRGYLLSEKPDTVFDRFYKTGESEKLNAVLSFLESPVERANFFEAAAKNTKDADLEKEYIKNVKELDGDFLEYRNGFIINPKEITNIYYTGVEEGANGVKTVGVRVNANGHEYKLPAFETAAQAGELFQALSRSNLMLMGNEYVNPKKIDFIEANTSENGKYFEILYKKFSTEVFLEESDDISDLLNKITSENPNMMEINGTSLINLDSLTQVFFDNENNAYFINGETCLMVLELNPSEQAALIKNLKQIDTLENIGAHFVNLNAVDGIAYDTDSGEVIIQAQNTVYNGRNKVRHFKDSFARFVLPPITMDKNELQAMEKILGDNGYVQNDEEKVFINPARLSLVNIEEYSDTLMKKFSFDFDGSQISLETHASDPKFAIALKKAANMTQVENTLLAVDRLTNISESLPKDARSLPHEAFVSLGSSVTRLNVKTLEGKVTMGNLIKTAKGMVDTGAEYITPKHIEAAFTKSETSIDVTFVNQDNCIVETTDLTKTFNDVHSNPRRTMAGKIRQRDAKTQQQLKDWSKLSRMQNIAKRAPSVVLFGDIANDDNIENARNTASPSKRGFSYGK